MPGREEGCRWTGMPHAYQVDRTVKTAVSHSGCSRPRHVALADCLDRETVVNVFSSLRRPEGGQRTVAEKLRATLSMTNCTCARSSNFARPATPFLPAAEETSSKSGAVTRARRGTSRSGGPARPPCARCGRQTSASDPAQDAAHAPPGDPHQLRHSGLRALHRQPGDLIVEAACEARAVVCPGHPEHHYAVIRTPELVWPGCELQFGPLQPPATLIQRSSVTLRGRHVSIEVEPRGERD